MKTHKLHSGFGLVEIMIAMLIGLFLLGGIIQMFISSKQTYKMQDAVGRLQENQRFAMDFLVHDLRGIGGWGCFRDQSYVQNLLNTAAPTNSVYAAATSSITGDNNHTSTGTGDLILTGTDNITLRSTSAVLTSAGADVAFRQHLSDPTATLSVTQGSGILVNEVLFLGDCEDGNIFQATTVTVGSGSSDDTIAHVTGTASTSSPANSIASLSKPYNTSARLYRFNVVKYYIGTGEGQQPALFRQLGNGGAGQVTELIEGVEDMQILYGEDTDGDGTPNYYVSSNNVANMNNVVSVQITLVMRTIDDNQVSTPAVFTLDKSKTGETANKTYNTGTGTTCPPANAAQDCRIRRSITSIISVRNRLI